MKPYEHIALHGIKYFTDNKGNTITVRLLSDNELVFSGHFIGITETDHNLPLIEGILIEQPQYNLHFFYKDKQDVRLVPVIVNVLLIDSMDDIKFKE